MTRCVRCGNPGLQFVSVRDPKTGKRRNVCGVCSRELAEADDDEECMETGYEEYEPWAA